MKYTKLFTAFAIFFILSGASCQVREAEKSDEIPVVPVAPVVAPTPPATNAAPTPLPPVEKQPETQVKTFNIKMSRFSFDPDTITVSKGDKVVVNATAVDTSHGFNLPDFGVNLVVPKGQTLSTTFIADKVGTFTFSCSVYCGGGHTDMAGKLIVK